MNTKYNYKKEKLNNGLELNFEYTIKEEIWPEKPVKPADFRLQILSETGNLSENFHCIGNIRKWTPKNKQRKDYGTWYNAAHFYCSIFTDAA